MRVFLAVASLRSAYGGPAVSVASLARALSEAGAEVGLWAADRSAPEANPAAGVAPFRRGQADALKSFGRPDVIHDNGLWLPHNHKLAVWAARHSVPRIVSTRGMLEPWAIHHKGLKKAAAWRIYQRRDLRRARLHHATSNAEADNLRRMNLGVPVCTIPNGVDLPVGAPPKPAPGTRSRIALFVGRIYPVKGLTMLVEAWARVRPTGWRLQIVGPDEAGHRAQIEEAVAASGLADVVLFSGPLDGAEKDAAFARADILVLPSHSESFGMVVAEALAHDLPVLTTTAVPWPGLVSNGCGWRVAPDVESLSEGLLEATSCDEASLRGMGARGRQLVAASFGWAGIARQFLAAYAQVGAA